MSARGVFIPDVFGYVGFLKSCAIRCRVYLKAAGLIIAKKKATMKMHLFSTNMETSVIL